MLSGIGEKHNLEIEIISKTRNAYRTVEYLASGLPITPAIMLEDELVIQGGPISEEAIKSAIHRHLVTE